MIVAAALCPSAPLLLPGVTGAGAALPELAAACRAAVAAVLNAAPEMVLAVGAAGPPVTLASFAPMLALGRGVPQPPRPLALLVADRLLDGAGWRGPTEHRTVAAPPPEDLPAERTALLVVADGPAPCQTVPGVPGLARGLDWRVLYDDAPYGVRYLVAAATRSASPIAS